MVRPVGCGWFSHSLIVQDAALKMSKNNNEASKMNDPHLRGQGLYFLYSVMLQLFYTMSRVTTMTRPQVDSWRCFHDATVFNDPDVNTDTLFCKVLALPPSALFYNLLQLTINRKHWLHWINSLKAWSAGTKDVFKWNDFMPVEKDVVLHSFKPRPKNANPSRGKSGCAETFCLQDPRSAPSVETDILLCCIRCWRVKRAAVPNRDF